MNFSAIISSFLLSGGVVMILISQQGVEFDDEGNQISDSSTYVVLAIGITFTIIGAIGFTFTTLSVIRRADHKMRKGEMRKLEIEVTRRIVASRKPTNVSQVPSIMVSHVQQ